jgi:predicted permease
MDQHRKVYDIPKLPFRILRWFCDPDILEDTQGDLTELYCERRREGKRWASAVLLADVLLLFRPGIIRRFTLIDYQTNSDMLLNHFRTAIRQARKYKGYTIINLSGLVVGIASCLLILLWVADELNMDKFHTNSDRLYQVWRNMSQASGEVSTTAGIPQPLEVVLREEYPEVEHVTGISWQMEFLFRQDDRSSYESGRYASPGFFQVFSYPFLIGNPVTALDNVHSLVISKRLAQKFFGDDWRDTALGQVVNVDERQPFVVTGVFDTPGANSSIQFDWIMPQKEFMDRNEWVDSWYNGGMRIYFSVHEGADVEAVSKRIFSEINDHTDNEAANETIVLQLFGENYLHGTFQDGRPVGGRVQYVRILSVIALFSLLVACINFMNLATARSSIRAREIGVRKVMGAQRSSLSQQFFAESFLHAFISVAFAVLVVWLLLPPFNTLTGKSLAIDFASEKWWMVIGGITILTGLLAGSYPAIMLSSFGIINSLKGSPKKSSSSAYFRNGLATFQFAISIFLISGTIVVSRQMQYILSKDLGLTREQVIMVEMDGALYQKNDIYRTALSKIPDVAGVTFSSGNPLSYGSSTGGARWEGKNPDDVVEINVLSVDAEFVQTMQMTLAEGSDFINQFVADSAHFVINEVLADIMGFKDTPVGKKLFVWGTEGIIIGVVKNFHMDSMYEPIAPLIMRYSPKDAGLAFIRIAGNTQEVLAGIERTNKSLNPAFPFRYQFMDEEYANTYRGEVAVSALTTIFAGVSIFISCLGLLGLSSFAADQRSREIGIRKVHGASTFNLILMLSRHYAGLMVIAFLVAAPLAYLYMHSWLDTFAYRSSPGIVLFAVAGMIALVLGIFTVTFKSYQAATANPIKTLREE